MNWESGLDRYLTTDTDFERHQKELDAFDAWLEANHDWLWDRFLKDVKAAKEEANI